MLQTLLSEVEAEADACSFEVLIALLHKRQLDQRIKTCPRWLSRVNYVANKIIERRRAKVYGFGSRIYELTYERVAELRARFYASTCLCGTCRPLPKRRYRSPL